MKFATAKEHRDFFQKQGWIEFEDLFSLSQCVTIDEAILEIVNRRMLASKHKLISSESFFQFGFDVWRDNPELKKWVMSSRLLDIIADLLNQETLRLGFDQFFSFISKNPLQESYSSEFIQHNLSLKEFSCVHGICGGVMIALNSHASSNDITESSSLNNASSIDLAMDENRYKGDVSVVRSELSSQPKWLAEGFDPFPYISGHVKIFHADIPIQWNSLIKHEGQSFYFVGVAEKHARYQLNPNDPHTHVYKKLGYVFNDRLRESLHPIIYRR